MLSRGNWLRTAVALNVLGLGLVIAACTRSMPTAPTGTLAAGSTAGAATSGSLAPITTTWACLAGGSNPFAGAESCPMRVGPAMLQVGAEVSNLTPPVGLRFTTNGNSVTFSWVASTAPGETVDTYTLVAGSSSGLSNLAVFDTNSAATTITVNNVPPGTFFVRVSARSAAGTSPFSNEVILTIGGSTPGGGACTPTAPSNLAFTLNGSSVGFTWNAPTGTCPATTYGVEAGSSAGASNLASILTGNSSTSFSAPNVPNGLYFVRVKAGNGSTVGPPSNEVAVNVGGGGTVALTILPAVLPSLRVGVPVSITFSVVGGTGTGLFFSPNSVGTQIPGLSINQPRPGMLSGTPTTAGPYLRGFTVIDSAGNTGTVVYSGTVSP